MSCSSEGVDGEGARWSREGWEYIKQRRVRAVTGLIAGAGGTAQSLLTHPVAWELTALQVSFTIPATSSAVIGSVELSAVREIYDGAGGLLGEIPIGDPNTTLSDIACGGPGAGPSTSCILLLLAASPIYVASMQYERVRITVTNNSPLAADTISLSFLSPMVAQRACMC